MDKLSPKQRSKLMAKIGSKNTSPEIKVRATLHALGYRFRLHRKDLPGKPDIVLPKYSLCIFVHGCFWHQHPKCKRATIPASNQNSWLEKFEKNRTRDKEVYAQLKKLGWQVATIWECQTKNEEILVEKLSSIFKDL